MVLSIVPPRLYCEVERQVNTDVAVDCRQTHAVDGRDTELHEGADTELANFSVLIFLLNVHLFPHDTGYVIMIDHDDTRYAAPMYVETTSIVEGT